MAKDIIFKSKPTFNIVNQHLKVNEQIEKMKNKIRLATTIQSAGNILRQEFPFANALVIYEALRETFQLATNEEIGLYLY